MEETVPRIARESAPQGPVARTLGRWTAAQLTMPGVWSAVEASLAAPRQFGDGQTRYEVAGAEMPHHDHLICVRCGLILEFENHEIEELQDSVAEKLGGFKIMNHKLELYGLCPKARGIPNGACPDHESRLGSAVGGVVGGRAGHHQHRDRGVPHDLGGPRTEEHPFDRAGLAGPDRCRQGTMDDAVETCLECVRDHLRRPIPGSRNLLMKTAGNTVNEIAPRVLSWPG